MAHTEDAWTNWIKALEVPFPEKLLLRERMYISVLSRPFSNVSGDRRSHGTSERIHSLQKSGCRKV
jgi:hypothetical protein